MHTLKEHLFVLMVDRNNIASIPLYSWFFWTVVLGVIAKYVISLLRPKRNIPAGPPGLPLLGNIFQLHKFQWLRFTEWRDQYGPIFSLNCAGQLVIVLNNNKVVADLFDRRSHIYSDRPRFIMAGEIITGGMFMALTGYGDLWRKLRRVTHECLNPRASESYQPQQEKEAASLVASLLRDPDGWEDHMKRSSTSTVLSAVYGWPTIESKDDPTVHKILSLIHIISLALLPGAYLVDFFPMMLYLPSWMAPWKREGLEWHKKGSALFQGFMKDVRDKVRTGRHQPSFAASLVNNEHQHGLSVTETAWLTGALIGAGGETTSATLSSFMLAMVLYPEVMHKAQAELDAVVGRDRMPSFSDKPHLPYIRAIVKEILRWMPVTPLGVPRRTTQDDWYNGHYIPKNTILIANVWGMNRDPEVFSDYDQFRPERFLDSTGTFDVTPSNTHGQGHVTYGFGKRICVGISVANQTLFIDVASILWALNIDRATDATGKEIVPSPNDWNDDGMELRPVPFKCLITPRATDVPAIVEMARPKEVFCNE